MLQRVRTKGLEGSKYDEYGCPAVIERERKVDEELIREICGAVGLLDDIVDVLHPSHAVSNSTLSEVTRVTHSHGGAD